MPYLDMSDPDNSTHLLQLFYAAHPHYRRANDAVRAQTEDPSYWLSAPVVQALADWARERRLITRRVATRLREAAQALAGHDDPATVMTPQPRIMGTPPRRQRTVLASEIFRWLYGSAAVVEPDTDDLVLTIGAAQAVLRRCMADPEENPLVVLRARRLLAWLAAQEAT